MPISRSFPVDKYGLMRQHHVLLEGSTFPPEKRSSMAQSIGPMTALLCYVRSEEKYTKKWARAVKIAMSHIPIIDDIIEVFKGKRAYEIAPLITTVGDVLLLTTSRQAQRIFFPLGVLTIVTTKAPKGNIQVTPKGAKILDKINMSGQGGFAAYKIMSEPKR